jgi:uncharacterized phage protein (TIGR01671 family)
MNTLQREIKFRVWDKINNAMHPVNWFDERVVNYKIPKSGNEPWNHAQVFRNECELMQFTGLKDDKNREVYEGDIVKFADITNAVISTSSVVWIEENSCWGLRGDGDAYPLSTFTTMKDRKITIMIFSIKEVIGNIYENPTLTEAVDKSTEVGASSEVVATQKKDQTKEGKE